MKLFKDGTLFIPPKALQFFSFVLRGSGGPRSRPCCISEGWYFSDPDPEEERCKRQKKQGNLFKEPGTFFLDKTFVGRWSANSAARDDGSVAHDVFRINDGGSCGLWKKNWKICSQKKTVRREIRHQPTRTGAEVKGGCHFMKIGCSRPATC